MRVHLWDAKTSTLFCRGSHRDRSPRANRRPRPSAARPCHGYVTRERRAPAAAPIGRRRERGVWWEVGWAHRSVSGGCCLLWRRAALWRPKLAELGATAGLCPLLLEGRGVKMRAVGRVRQRGDALSFSLGNTLRVPPLASPGRLRPMPSGLRALRRRLVELLPGCVLILSRPLIPLVSQHSGRGGSGVLETPFCFPRGVGSPAFSRRFGAGKGGSDWVELSIVSLAHLPVRSKGQKVLH